MKHDTALSYTFVLLAGLGCPALAQESLSTSVARPPLEELVARMRTAVGAEAHGRQGKPLTLAGKSFGMGIEADSALTFSPGGAFLNRIAGDLGVTVGWDGTSAWKTDYDGSTRTLALEEHDQELFEHWIQTGHWLDPRAPIAIEWAEDRPDGVWIEVSIRDTPMGASMRIDPETSLPAEMVQPSSAGHKTWSFADWREHGALRVPHDVRVVEESGMESWTRWEKVSTPPTTVRSPYARPVARPDDVTFDSTQPAELETKRVFSGHVLVHPTIEGEDVGWFILDTGAGAMCIDTGIADELELESFGEVLAVGASGKTDAHFRRGKLFELGRLRFEDPIYVELDLEFLTAAFNETIAGIVGYDLFARSLVEFDPSTGRTHLYDPASYELPGGEWQPLVLDARTPAVQASFEGDHQAYFRLDTGAGSGNVTFHTPTVERLGLLEGRKVTASGSGGVGGSSVTYTGKLEWFELAGKRFEQPTVGFSTAEVGGLADRYTAGNLGQAFLEPFTLVLDYPNERIAFVPREE